ncbi:hypothetical protein SAMN04488036_11171 [Shimia haliotis]|uniref:Uncharacterized protein n=1 Tax=Shimia haliotis TaxID=1280847 RepID=A0A1I4H9D3_9RHOB|nr:hypothetical protein SAMN04488036_11171 [Shimia haliotis]
MGMMVSGNDSDTPPETEETPDDDTQDLQHQIEHHIHSGTDADDTLRLPPATDNPIMAIGGAGADTFVAEYPHRADDDRPYDVIVPDFDPEEDVLTLEVIAEDRLPNAETPQNFRIVPAEDGSYVDVRVAVFDPELGAEAANDYVVRLDGLSDVSPDCIFLADTNCEETDPSQPAEPDESAIVIEGDVGQLVERGTRADDTILVRHDSGSVVVKGGAGEDTIDARDFEKSDVASLRIDGSEGDDTYLFSQGINVSDDQFGGADVYSMTVDPETMHTHSPSTVVWDFNDQFELILPAEHAAQVRIENQPPRYDINLGATVQRDDVFVGDTLVMRLINLDEENRITLDSTQFTIASPTPA